MSAAAGIAAGAVVYRLPGGASPTATPVLRPLPGGAGRLCVGLLGGGALPAWVLPGAAHPAAAWALVPGPEGAILLGGDRLLDSPPVDAALAPLPSFPPARLRLSRTGSAPEASPEPSPAPAGGGFRLILRDAALDIPFGAMERLLPMPALHPAPEAPEGVLGLAWTAAGPVLVLEPGVAAGGAPDSGPFPLLAVLAVEGRHLGLPCQRALPVAEAASIPAALTRAAFLASAPLAAPSPPPVPVPTRLLLVARAGEASFALPVEEVIAVMPPQAPRNRRGGALSGIAAHRGDVLPVLDAGERLGQPPVLAGGTAMALLRLSGAQPVALAISSVQGLRHVLEADLVPVPGDGLVAAVARLDGVALPVCRARAFALVLAGHAP
jgi:chemotaxis signal transduction protein